MDVARLGADGECTGLGYVVVALSPVAGARAAPLWATVLIYLLAVAVILALRPRAVMQVLRTPALWVLIVASGITNAAFNWAMVIGDVVRVILLFYLMPLWAVLLARLLLAEPLTGGRGPARGAGAGGRGHRAVARRSQRLGRPATPALAARLAGRGRRLLRSP